MKIPTNIDIVLTIDEMEKIIEQMKENQKRNRSLSNQVKFKLVNDTDWNAHRIDTFTSGYQFNSYAECNGEYLKSLETNRIE